MAGSSLNTRISALIEAKGMKPRTFALQCGLSPQTIHNIIGKRKSEPSFDVLKTILSTFEDISPDWLIHGTGKMFRAGSAIAKKVSSVSEPEFNYGKVPLVKVEALGGEGNTVFKIEQKDIQDYYVVPDFVNINFMLRVRGSSMYPKYTSGDVIACRVIKEDSFIQWGKVYVIATKEQGILVKRIKKSDKKSHIQAVSDNASFEPFDIPQEEIEGLALVVGVIRLE